MKRYIKIKITFTVALLVLTGFTCKTWKFLDQYTNLDAPANVETISSDKQISISWKEVQGATSYNLYWATSAGVTTSNGTKISGVKSPYTHSGLTNGKTYYYIVCSNNNDGESKPSAEVSQTPVVGSCDVTSLMGICLAYTGSTWTTSAAQAQCAATGGGVFSTNNCSRKNCVSECYVAMTPGQEAIYYFYSSYDSSVVYIREMCIAAAYTTLTYSPVCN